MQHGRLVGQARPGRTAPVFGRSAAGVPRIADNSFSPRTSSANSSIPQAEQGTSIPARSRWICELFGRGGGRAGRAIALEMEPVHNQIRYRQSPAQQSLNSARVT